MTLRDLTLRLRALIVPRRVERELDDELAFHIERETQKQVASGLSPADARARALARFGSVALAADRCRDARGTALVENTVRDILYAFRTFRRAPLVALTIVTTVALGLGLVAVVFTFYNGLFLRADAVRHPGELFEVRRPPSPGATKVWVPLTRRDYDALRRDTSVFTDAFAMLPGVETRIDGRMTSGTLVTGNFFQTLGVNAARGRTMIPIDDERFAGRPVIVLSHRGWTRLFAEDPMQRAVNERERGCYHWCASRISRARHVSTGLLGSVRSSWPVPSRTGWKGRRRCDRSCRTPETRCVARSGHRGADGLGVRKCRDAGVERSPQDDLLETQPGNDVA